MILDWDKRTQTLWGNTPVCVKHRLQHNMLFSMDYLAKLIDRYKPEQYTLVHMGPQGSSKRAWVEGKIRAGMSGKQVIEMIRNERLWINLLHVNEVDTSYQTLLDKIYGEIEHQVPDHPRTYKRICGILISSPRAQVYYHFDTSGQSLWQIHGNKHVLVYPPTEPFLNKQELSDVVLYHNEVGVSFERWYDDLALRFYLDAGSMLHWPLNAPHRIENGDELSVSFTTEYFTWPIRKHVWNVGFEGLTGIPSAWVPTPIKAGTMAIAQRSGILNKKRAARRPIHFMLPELPR